MTYRVVLDSNNDMNKEVRIVTATLVRLDIYWSISQRFLGLHTVMYIT